MSAPPDRISELLHSMQSCISDVKAWATANMLKPNDSKTELMHVTSKRSKHLHNLPTSITIGNAQIPLKQSVKNLGFTFDCHLTMNAHVSNIARTCYFELRRLASIRRFLISTAIATLVSAFVLSIMYMCVSWLCVDIRGYNHIYYKLYSLNYLCASNFGGCLELTYSHLLRYCNQGCCLFCESKHDGLICI